MIWDSEVMSLQTVCTWGGGSCWKRNFVSEKIVYCFPHRISVQSSKTMACPVKLLGDLWWCYSEFLGNFRFYLKAGKCILGGAGELLRFLGVFLMFSLCFLIHDLSSCLVACLDASYCVTPGWCERWNVIFVAALPWILWEALFPDTHAKLPNFLFNFCILLHSPIWIWLCQRCVCSSLPGGATAIWSTVWTITQFSHR